MTKEKIIAEELDAVSEETLKGNFCPCCGQPNKFRQAPEWILLHFGGISQRLLILLLEKRRVQGSADMSELLRVAYTDAGREMPKNAASSIHVLMHYMRKRLNSLGWDHVGPATTRKGYMLVPLE
jgi:hypothetical protein